MALLPPRVARWGGFALGALAPLAVVFGVAHIVTSHYQGLDGSPEFSVAVIGTRDLANALDRYRNRYHHIPDTREGLAKLAPEFMPAVPNDPWGRPYIYQPTGPSWADVLTYGADGQPGGDGSDGDISARFGRLGSRPPSYLHSFVSLVVMGMALFASLGAARFPLCTGALAGMGAFWGCLLLTMVGGPSQSLVGPSGFVLGVGSLVGAIAVLRDLPFARLVAFLAIVFAYLFIEFLITS